MIIIGEMNLTLKKGVGQFYCPMCRQARNYVHRRVKRFLTLYFVPVLPIATVSEHIRCEHCRQTLPLSAIHKSAAVYEEEQREEFANDVRRVMVLTMLADGHADSAELAVIRSVYWKLSGTDLSDTDLAMDVKQAQRARVDARQYARAVALRRNEEEKEWILRGAFLVASAQGPISPQRLDVLKGLPESLNVSEDRFRQIIAEAS